MTELIWLTTVAKDVLSMSAQLLEGQVPCPPAKLAAALQKADGLSRQSSPDTGFREITAECGPVLLDLFTKVVQDKLQRIRSKSKQWVAKLPTGAVSYNAVLGACKDGLPEVLRRDWVLWHSVGSDHYPKEGRFEPCDILRLPLPSRQDVPALPAEVNERIALLACAGDTPLADFAVRSHVLENLDKYQSWEAKRLRQNGTSIHESESAEGPHFLACLLGPLVDRACFCLACSAKFRARFYDLLQDLVV
eukprot:s6262_g4.t1